MCAVEPIPLILETMKNSKLVSLVSEARKGQGVHAYTKGVCIHSPAKILSLLRQFYPDTLLKVTVVNYVLEDNPEFRLRLWDGVWTEVNIVLKNSEITIDFNSENDYGGDTAKLDVKHKFRLNKGEYIVMSVSCKMIDSTPCTDYDRCTSLGVLQFEFNGVPLGEMPLKYMYLNPIFRLLEIFGLGNRTSAREVHWVYNNIINSFVLFEMQAMYDVPFLQMRAKNDYLWAGDSAVLTGTFRYMNALYKGIAVGVTINGIVPADMKDFVRYKDYIGAVTFTISVGMNASIVSTEDEIFVCKIIKAGTRCLIPTFHNMNLDNFETYAMTWPDDEW